jgi:hypothetical protein
MRCCYVVEFASRLGPRLAPFPPKGHIMDNTETDSQTANGVFKPVGHVFVSFPTERDARSAMAALKAAGFADEDVVYQSPGQVKARADKDVQNAGVLASIGQELNIAKAQRELARQGHSFLCVHAPEDDAARKVGDIVSRYSADRAQKYGRLIIEELIEPGTGQRQVAESPDRGLDSQTVSGVEGDTPTAPR